MKKTILIFLAFFAVSMIQAQSPAPADSLSIYTGKYKFPDGSMVAEINVTLENGVLTANSVLGSSGLRKTEGDVFEIVAYGGTAAFKRNAESKITSVVITVGNTSMEGARSEGLWLNSKVFFIGKTPPEG